MKCYIVVSVTTRESSRHYSIVQMSESLHDSVYGYSRDLYDLGITHGEYRPAEPGLWIIFGTLREDFSAWQQPAWIYSAKYENGFRRLTPSELLDIAEGRYLPETACLEVKP